MYTLLVFKLTIELAIACSKDLSSIFVLDKPLKLKLNLRNEYK